MPISIKPESIKTGGKVAAAGGGFTALAAAIVYAIVELHGSGESTAQATRDLKQDMEIQYIKAAVVEIKGDIREIRKDQRKITKKITDDSD